MKKTTKELEGILLNAHSANAEQIFTENNYSFVNKTFSDVEKVMKICYNNMVLIMEEYYEK